MARGAPLAMASTSVPVGPATGTAANIAREETLNDRKVPLVRRSAPDRPPATRQHAALLPARMPMGVLECSEAMGGDGVAAGHLTVDDLRAAERSAHALRDPSEGTK